ncbi:desaturase [Fragilaria crotonensis]|nr:desaturase [Fragilaria crotonensis]
MAPDAEQVRQNRNAAGRTLAEEEDIPVVELEQTQTEMSVFKDANDLTGNLIAIDGIVFTLDHFNHPGGEQIKLFGGNDVTVQYKMIHPHHTSKHLNKLKIVGKLAKSDNEYQFDTPFERELKQEVFKIVKRGQEFGTMGYMARATFYIALYLTCLYYWITQESTLTLAAIFGIAHALIGLNVQHDANHGAASRKPFINDLLGFGVDLIGGSKWLWMEQHWTHHAFTNHKDKDPDAISAEPMIILNDYPVGHPKRRWYHNFQLLWTLPLLGLYWVSIVFSTDVVHLKHPGALSVGVNLDNDFIRNRRVYAMLSRLIYVLAVFVPPFYHRGMTWTPLVHLMAMGFIGSLLLSTLFIISHNFDAVERDPTAEARRNGTKVCWYKSQVETSSTYGGFVSGCLTGGLNFQIEHHLFPRMSSAWYPYIAPKVREVCKKHGVKYAYYPWLWQNLFATAQHIHAAGTGSLSGNKKD